MNKNEKEVFLNMMSLVSDYPKYIMLEKFLEGNPLTVKNFTSPDIHLSCRAVYHNLHSWRNDGILSVDEEIGSNKIYHYRLNVEKLLEFMYPPIREYMGENFEFKHIYNQFYKGELD